MSTRIERDLRSPADNKVGAFPEPLVRHERQALALGVWDPAELPDEMAISAITLAGDMIAATAIAEGLPLYTTNPADFTGLDRLARIIPVTRPPVQHERPFS